MQIAPLTEELKSSAARQRALARILSARPAICPFPSFMSHQRSIPSCAESGFQVALPSLSGISLPDALKPFLVHVSTTHSTSTLVAKSSAVGDSAVLTLVSLPRSVVFEKLSSLFLYLCLTPSPSLIRLALSLFTDSPSTLHTR